MPRIKEKLVTLNVNVDLSAILLVLFFLSPSKSDVVRELMKLLA